MNDWMDAAWLDFVDEISPHSFNADGLKLLKAAWLHGARAAIDKAVTLSKAPTSSEPEGR